MGIGKRPHGIGLTMVLGGELCIDGTMELCGWYRYPVGIYSRLSSPPTRSRYLFMYAGEGVIDTLAQWQLYEVKLKALEKIRLTS